MSEREIIKSKIQLNYDRSLANRKHILVPRRNPHTYVVNRFIRSCLDAAHEEIEQTGEIMNIYYMRDVFNRIDSYMSQRLSDDEITEHIFNDGVAHHYINTYIDIGVIFNSLPLLEAIQRIVEMMMLNVPTDTSVRET